MKTKLILLALCCLLLALTAGCAAPGAPQPPSLRLPTLVNNLSAVRKGSRVVLTWSPPTETTDHQPLRWPTTTRICRVVNQFPIATCGEIVAQIKTSDLASEAPSARRPEVSFEDVLPASLIARAETAPKGAALESQATYAVEVVNQRGRSAGLSNQERISLVATEPAPDSFRVSLDAEGPQLHWELAPGPILSSSAAAAGISCQLRIYRRSPNKSEGKNQGKPQGKNQGMTGFALVSEQPCQPGPGEARDNSFEWEHEYDYKAVAVTVIAAAGYPPVEVEGDDSSIAHLVAHDIFPPAAPRGVQAIFSSVGQKPFIDLTWEPNTEGDLAGYIVYRSSGGSVYAAVSPSELKSPAWRDYDVQPGQSYRYAVTAVDLRHNESARSEEATESVPQNSQEVR